MNHNQCFEQKLENSKKISNENCHYYGREISLYVAWACFHNGIISELALHISIVLLVQYKFTASLLV